MSLVEHARRELKLADAFRDDPEFAEALVKAVEGFFSYPHSGGSAGAGLQILERLLRGEALRPLTSDPAEWEDRSDITGGPMWQNLRDSRAMSDDGGKTWWYVEARRPGERCRDGGDWGVLVHCGRCNGDGLLHLRDEVPAAVAPSPEPQP